MKTLNLLTGFSFTLFFSCLLLFQLQPAQADDILCLGCHSDLKGGKNVHAAFSMGCATCHTRVEGKGHPTEKGSVKLNQDMPGLCYGCHDESKFKGKTVHAPVAGGMCTSCHNPHSSNYSKLLVKDPPELCYICHNKADFTKKVVHKVINVVGCGSCHSPHASNFPDLLPSPINDVCITCHKGQAKGNHVISLPGGRFHPIKGVIDISTLKMIKVPDPKRPGKEIEIPDPKVPGKELSCASCHNPHSSDYKNLFPAQRVCLKCHKY
jgi:predicted CXXCH cytochrome family protein